MIFQGNLFSFVFWTIEYTKNLYLQDAVFRDGDEPLPDFFLLAVLLVRLLLQDLKVFYIRLKAFLK